MASEYAYAAAAITASVHELLDGCDIPRGDKNIFQRLGDLVSLYRHYRWQSGHYKALYEASLNEICKLDKEMSDVN